jgi:hypothetical protein
MAQSLYNVDVLRFLSIAALLLLAPAVALRGEQDAKNPVNPPYPPSTDLKGLAWHWDTLRQAALGSDLWPVTWAEDGDLYLAWGDGGGFGGSDTEGRVALGFARIRGGPESFRGENVNGGKDPEHPASFPRTGKCGGIVAIGGALYAWINLQDGKWPDVNQGLAWSEDRGATWTRSAWVFPKGEGRIKPSTFLSFGKSIQGAPRELRDYVYFYGGRQGDDTEQFLGRVPVDKLKFREAYQYFAGVSKGKPVWSADETTASEVFTDAHGVGDLATVMYDAPLRRFLLTAFHTGPGQLGVFESTQPWGPWKTVTYVEDWGGMGAAGQGLNCSFPQKWLSKDGRTLWCIFSAYGDGAKQGIHAHDRFNLVRVTLER